MLNKKSSAEQKMQNSDLQSFLYMPAKENAGFKFFVSHALKFLSCGAGKSSSP